MKSFFSVISEFLYKVERLFEGNDNNKSMNNYLVMVSSGYELANLIATRAFNLCLNEFWTWE